MENPEEWLFLQLVLEEGVYVIPEAKQAESPTHAQEKQAPLPIALMGEMKAGVLIAVDSPNFQLSPAYDFLMKILLAVKLAPGDVGILVPGYTWQPGFSIGALQQNRPFTKMMLFGVPAATLSLATQPFYETVSHGGLKVLAAEALEAIMNDVQKKKSLWAAMQQLFADRL